MGVCLGCGVGATKGTEFSIGPRVGLSVKYGETGTEPLFNLYDTAGSISDSFSDFNRSMDEFLRNCAN